MTDLAEYTEMWTKNQDRYVIVQLPGRKASEAVILEKATRLAILIEDDDVYTQLLAKMREAGVETVSELPK